MGKMINILCIKKEKKARGVFGKSEKYLGWMGEREIYIFLAWRFGSWGVCVAATGDMDVSLRYGYCYRAYVLKDRLARS